jgi:hypothetical protein
MEFRVYLMSSGWNIYLSIMEVNENRSDKGYLVKYLIYLFCALLIVLFVSLANAKNLHFEKFYQERWCKANGGETEVVFPDKTRCDCLTSTHAIEFDFGKKWAEAIGQALYYSIQTGKRAGVVLILEKPGDYKYWIRLNTVIEHFGLPIDTWITVPPGGLD